MRKFCRILIISIVLGLFLNACGKPKSRTVVIYHANNQLFTVGEPKVNYYSNGASLDYFIPGAIVVFKCDKTVLNQKCKAGTVYQLSKDTLLLEIGKIDTTLNDTVIANQYLISEIESDTE